MILTRYLKYIFLAFFKRIYWLYLFSKAQKGRGFHCEFPIRIGGKGKLSFGNNCNVLKNTYFACGNGGSITFGNNCFVDTNVEIAVGKNANIVFGDNCKILKNTVIHANSHLIFENDVIVATNCALFSRENGYSGILNVGKGCHIGDNTIMDIADNITIEEEVAIGPNCVIYTHDHDYSVKEKAAWKGGVVSKPIIIKAGAWIGSNVTLLPGIVIEKRSVIAAGAVVSKNTEKNTIYGGIPAKKIKFING